MAGHIDHGHTPAAWTGVIIVFVGFMIAGGFIIAAQPAGFWAGIGVTLLGPVVGGAMRVMGLGKKDEPLVRTPSAAQQEQGEAPVHANA